MSLAGLYSADPETLPAWWGAQSPGCHTWMTSQEWWHPSLFVWPLPLTLRIIILTCPKGWKFNPWLTEGKAYILDLQRMFSQLILEPVLWLGLFLFLYRLAWITNGLKHWWSNIHLQTLSAMWQISAWASSHRDLPSGPHGLSRILCSHRGCSLQLLPEVTYEVTSPCFHVGTVRICDLVCFSRQFLCGALAVLELPL